MIDSNILADYAHLSARVSIIVILDENSLDGNSSLDTLLVIYARRYA